MVLRPPEYVTGWPWADSAAPESMRLSPEYVTGLPLTEPGPVAPPTVLPAARKLTQIGKVKGLTARSLSHTYGERVKASQKMYDLPCWYA